MKAINLLLVLAFLVSCETQLSPTPKASSDSLNQVARSKAIEPEKRYRTISQVTADTGISIWRAGSLDASSRFHFNQLRDTLLIEYYPECWGDYPIKIIDSTIVAYWNDNLDTKYDFDVVGIINRNKRLKGQPFLSFRLSSDTTLDVSYLNEQLVHSINQVNRERTFLPQKLKIEASE